ncbi:MAG: enoyl-CoA hydratase/isomerase family protein [Saprospiraceae bacterium]|jgi:2-(1,2-epoxy-1,2-dihydrophenyl)acetyl-CoA isomerase|nr:enoyl-CoA hydratase/isomerase family protein [Saprospiraceae bacterium]
MNTIEFNIENGIAKIVLQRPEVYNSFNKEMALAVQKALDESKAEEVRVVLITGTGKAFCAGQDLQEVVDPNGPPLKSIVSEHYNPIILKINELEKPVVAAVNGVAAGAGANIALNCDIVFAKKSASFLQAFSKIGLIPDSGGTHILPRLVGMQKAAGLMMFAEKISAEDAEKMGMIYKVFEDENFENEVESHVNFLANMPTRALAQTKKLLQLSIKSDLKTQLDLEGQYQTLAGQSHDYSEGVQAFLEKRKPIFLGK